MTTMTLSLRDFQSDLAELGLEIMWHEGALRSYWRIGPIHLAPGQREQVAGFSTLAEAYVWWRKNAADFALRESALVHMREFLASVPASTLDDASMWLTWLREKFYKPELAPPSPFPPDLEKALRILENIDRLPGLHSVHLCESGHGWRRRAIDTWRSSQQANGWCYGPFLGTSRWALGMVEQEALSRLGALPPATVGTGRRARL